MHSLAVRRAALVATRAASRSSTRGSGSNGSSRARALCSRSPSALSASLRQRTPPPLAASPPPPLYALSPRHRHIRCYASRKEEDKSWGEIAGDAAEVAKGALKKLGLGALNAVEKVLGGGGGGGGDKSASSPSSQRRGPRPGDEGDGDSFWGPMSGPRSPSSPRTRDGRGGGTIVGGGGGLLGGLVGSVLGKAVQGAFSAIAEQSREAGLLAEAALDAANGDAGVRDEFGGLLRRAGGAGIGSMAQSSSTVVVNGRARRSTSVSFPVAGPRGGGILEATSTGGDGGEGEEVVVRVRSQRGRMITVGGAGSGGRGGGGSRGSGDVIDVDFREV